MPKKITREQFKEVCNPMVDCNQELINIAHTLEMMGVHSDHYESILECVRILAKVRFILAEEACE